MAKKSMRGTFRLTIPLDASGIEGFEPEQAIKVAVQARDGSLQSRTVKLDAKGKGAATFTFGERPGTLRVVVGPDSASDEELLGMQTISLDVSARQWLDKPQLALPPIRIPPYYWYWWLRWCRTFTIRGRVVCPDGRPVPGAKVCAYDVDMWWWWSSRQQVGCDTTDASGAFEIRFRWCCGWWPWWWWLRRVWYLEPILAERILPVLQRELKLRKIPIPDPKPDPTIFEELLAEDQIAAPLPPVEVKLAEVNANPVAVRGTLRQPQAGFNPAVLDRIRDRLKGRLPAVPELERLRLWPWWPWHPWWDCTPDIILRVTQNCRGAETVIVDEGVWDTRWNIPTTLNVTLVASNEACCIQPQDDPVGVCMVITHACDDPIQFIGGNPKAPATPAGYRDPGKTWISGNIYGDRPYAGVVPVRGLFGDRAGVDYYEFEWSDDGGATWNAMPAAASGGFNRWYWGPKVGTADPPDFHRVAFSFASISGRRVIQSREHFEDNNAPASWGITRFWTHHRDWLMRWLTKNNFADGTYRLRVKSWDLGAGGNLVNPRILPLCNTTDDNGIVLRTDNRIVGPGSGHPTTSDHRCGAGTVHICTTEPDTDFLDVRINGVSYGACAVVDAKAGGQLEIDFMAHDPDGHLAYYTLVATYGENLVVNLLYLPSAALASGPLGGPVPPAAQVGPTYADARTAQGAVAPTWKGGTLTLTISDLSQAFPAECCYQLELRAYKRTIANCDDNVPYRNRSEFILTVLR
jgi:hypothetical protein